jgi:fatty acid desaturase
MSATAETQPGVTSWRDVFTTEERKQLLELDPWRAAWSFARTWGIIALAFAAVALAPGVPAKLLVGLVALFLIGAQQLGLAVLMHEASHYSLFRDRKANDLVTNWLAAYPIWADIAPYRRYHLVHHAHTGTEKDPDLSLASPFPITRESFRRKVWRDLSGQTGWAQARATFVRDVGISLRATQRTQGLKVGETPDVGWHKLTGVTVTNLVLFAILALCGHPGLYLLWLGAWFTSYRFCMRIRAIAEHAMVPDQSDPLRNTRTTLLKPWEAILIAPNGVNYHYEHHLLMAVPHYNLPRMHRMLRERGAIDEDCIAYGYGEILRMATSKA